MWGSQPYSFLFLRSLGWVALKIHSFTPRKNKSQTQKKITHDLFTYNYKKVSHYFPII